MAGILTPLPTGPGSLQVITGKQNRSQTTFSGGSRISDIVGAHNHWNGLAPELYFVKMDQKNQKQVCISVGCVPPACWPYLPACTARGCLLPGGCLLLGVSAPGWWCLLWCGCVCSWGSVYSGWGGVSTLAWGVSALGGVCSRGVCSGGVWCLLMGGGLGVRVCIPACTEADTPL